MKLFTKNIAIALLFLAAFSFTTPLFAQDFSNKTSSDFSSNSSSDFSSNTSCGKSANGVFTLCNPLAVSNFCDLVKALLNIVLAIGVPIAVLFLVWSGFRFILARGNPTELENARKNFMYVIVGIAIFLGAWTFATIISATIQSLDSSGTIQFCGRS